MKANPSRGVLALFRELGLHIDASSDHEVERALRAGFGPETIQLTSQMPSRRLREHVEPGTYLVANGGFVVATCVDVVDTGRAGYVFAKLDTGMTEVTRPSLYGAQHPIHVLAESRDEADVVFVGPCCESGDILTPAPGDPEALAPRRVARPRIGDLVVVGGAGAYCAAMSTINYNSYPQAPEVMLQPDGTLQLLRRRQRPDEIWTSEA
jgi:diaminopimelate decarboxylase